MTALASDVAGIGNAIVDVLAKADEAFLAREALAKGGMTLIDAARAEQLYAAMGPAREVSRPEQSLIRLSRLSHHSGRRSPRALSAAAPLETLSGARRAGPVPRVLARRRQTAARRFRCRVATWAFAMQNTRQERL